MMKEAKFYTLLYIDTENKPLSINGVSGPFEEQMELFIHCCEALSRSIRYFVSSELTVLTNNKAYIERISDQLRCVEIDFHLKFPAEIRFSASHRKIDAYRYFARLGENEYSFLIDSDVLCINKMPPNLLHCVEKNIPVYYDITDQAYPAYSRERILTDKAVLMGEVKSIGNWAGGEFIGGGPKFFQALYDEIALIMDTYLANFHKFHHISDETLVSVALEKLMMNQYICNVGIFGGIGRYWSSRTLHVQNRWKSYFHCFLIHLPDDKKFIANTSRIDENLAKRYRNYLFRRPFEIRRLARKARERIFGT